MNFKVFPLPCRSRDAFNDPSPIFLMNAVLDLLGRGRTFVRVEPAYAVLLQRPVDTLPACDTPGPASRMAQPLSLG
jgi:hypothetical protein